MSNEIAEIWLVRDEHDVNQLLKVGWKFIQVVYETKRVTDVGWFSAKERAVGNVVKYLMGRSNGIAPRKESGYETVDDYVKKVKKKENERK